MTLHQAYWELQVEAMTFHGVMTLHQKQNFMVREVLGRERRREMTKDERECKVGLRSGKCIQGHGEGCGGFTFVVVHLWLYISLGLWFPICWLGVWTV
jgi:hypothetical protein